MHWSIVFLSKQAQEKGFWKVPLQHASSASSASSVSVSCRELPCCYQGACEWCGWDWCGWDWCGGNCRNCQRSALSKSERFWWLTDRSWTNAFCGWAKHKNRSISCPHFAKKVSHAVPDWQYIYIYIIYIYIIYIYIYILYIYYIIYILLYYIILYYIILYYIILSPSLWNMLRRGGSTCPNIELTWWTKQRGYTKTNCVSILLWTFECEQQIDLNVYRTQQNRNLSHLSHPFTPSSHSQVCGESRMEETASVCSKVLVCVVSVVVIDVETVAEVVVFTDVVVHVVTVPVVDVVVIVVAVSEVVVIEVVVIVVTVTEVVVCVVTVAVTEVVVRVVAVTEVVVTVVAVADTDLSAPAFTSPIQNWPFITSRLPTFGYSKWTCIWDEHPKSSNHQLNAILPITNQHTHNLELCMLIVISYVIS